MQSIKNALWNRRFMIRHWLEKHYRRNEHGFPVGFLRWNPWVSYIDWRWQHLCGYGSKPVMPPLRSIFYRPKGNAQ